MLTVKTDTELELKRTLKAPVDKVFKAWTEPEQLSKWFGCGRAEKVEVQQDLRVGGEYRIDVQLPEGKCVSASGKFIEIVRNQKLVYSWNNTSPEHPAKDTVVSIQFIEQGDTTEVILKHTKFDKPVSVEGHTIGWEGVFDKLAAYLA